MVSQYFYLKLSYFESVICSCWDPDSQEWLPSCLLYYLLSLHASVFPDSLVAAYFLFSSNITSYVSPIRAGICVCCVWLIHYSILYIWMAHGRCLINNHWVNEWMLHWEDLSFHFSVKPFPDNFIHLFINLIELNLINLKRTEEEPGHLGSKSGSKSLILGTLLISQLWNYVIFADPTLHGGFKDHMRNKCESAHVQGVLIILVTIIPYVFRELLSAYLSCHNREPRRKKKYLNLTKPIL